jgi:4-hydroxymandelate oxidase
MALKLQTLDDYEPAARAVMDVGAFEYVASGAASEHTLRANRTAFDKLDLLPKVLRDVSSINTGVELFGQVHRVPMLLAPTGYHRLVHARGELETIDGANQADCTLVASSFATETFAAVQAVAKRPQWFQLYVQQDRGYTRELLSRVIEAGCAAVCVTVDLPVNPTRDREGRIGFELPRGMMRANLEGMGVAFAQAARATHGSNIYNAVRACDLTWKDVDWLREVCPVPLLLKGILRAEDAREARAHGCDGVIVSNHGGRALDSVPATMAVLPGIVDAVGEEMTVLADGGIRRGTDVAKALALGAKAVLVGRPYLFAMAVEGAAGVARVMNLLKVELEVAMGLLGCREIAELDPSVILPRG